MDEAALPLLDRLVRIRSINPLQARQQAHMEVLRGEIRARLGPPPATTWQNLSELDQMVSSLFTRGRVVSVADLLEHANPPERSSWEETDRVATIRLHLGEPARARALWQSAVKPPRPGVRLARVAVTHLVEGAIEAARTSFREAIEVDPDLFEAHYGLAVLEQDDGRAESSYREALKAMETARDDVSRAAAQAIASRVGRFVGGRGTVGSR
jgi:hypothetical protein